MAGNDTEGLRYGTIQTPEKYYLTWKEESHRLKTRWTAPNTSFNCAAKDAFPLDLGTP
jgi:hypothetical protein